MAHYYLIVFLLSAISSSISVDPSAVPKQQYTRTALHVSRSLNPDTTQLLQVKTRSGDVATLIVKKRDGKQHSTSTPVNSTREETRRFNTDDTRFQFLPSSVNVRSEEHFVKNQDADVEDTRARGRATVRDQKADVRVPPPVYIRSMPMFVKGEREDEIKRGRSLMKIGADGIPVIQGVRMPDDESDKQVWRNARVINGELVPIAKPGLVIKKDNKKKETTVLERIPLERRQDETNRFEASHIERLAPHQHVPTNTQTDQRLIDFIKTINQREMQRKANVNSRARMIQFPADRRMDSSQEYSSAEIKRSDSSAESSEFQPRMLHYGSPIYPTSLLYTPQSKKPARASFEEGVRTPVLQYAHPELGVQPARLQPKSAKAVTSGISHKHIAATMAMFHQDLHSDRSPYVGMETEIDSDISDKRSNDGAHSASTKTNYYQSSTENTPNRNYAYDNQNYEFPKKNYYQSQDSYGLSNDDYIKRYPYDGYNSVNSYNSYSGPYLVKVVERPFWEQITDTIRDHVQTGMDRVSDLTRPVVEPLIEASHKISKNLGFAQRSHDVHAIQEKVGGAVSSYPVLLPALGLMAGGAALGLGAAAVGRYLDVDMMRKRSEDMTAEEMEHKRALEATHGGEWILLQEPKTSARGRSLTVDNTDSEGAQEGRWVLVEKDQDEVKETSQKSEEVTREQREDKVNDKDSSPTEVKLPIRVQRVITDSVQDEWIPVAVEEVTSVQERGHRVKRATESDFMSDILQSIETSTPSGLEHLEHHSDWTSTPCSKRLFCDTMIKQSEDAILLMEKKMATFLSLIEPNIAVSYHLGDVMAAVKRHDCSSYKCVDAKHQPR